MWQGGLFSPVQSSGGNSSSVRPAVVPGPYRGGDGLLSRSTDALTISTHQLMRSKRISGKLSSLSRLSAVGTTIRITTMTGSDYCCYGVVLPLFLFLLSTVMNGSPEQIAFPTQGWSLERTLMTSTLWSGSAHTYTTQSCKYSYETWPNYKYIQCYSKGVLCFYVMFKCNKATFIWSKTK